MQFTVVVFPYTSLGAKQLEGKSKLQSLLDTRAGLEHSCSWGRMPAGIAMVPMVLPDGRVGYVLQQPGAQTPVPPQSRRDDSGSSDSCRSQGSGGNNGGDGGRSWR
ncbi:hypothetical protein C5167_042851 [Papaver somniferum]|uniref:Uncharacterized protein n=1 Tax=Papaver somniferum TaxID=3469 RepID=A0A4Y7L7W8_PAPSO|nr:hypothetical protein C5167_042851 [Papaver somniferum]